MYSLTENDFQGTFIAGTTPEVKLMGPRDEDDQFAVHYLSQRGIELRNTNKTFSNFGDFTQDQILEFMERTGVALLGVVVPSPAPTPLQLLVNGLKKQT